MIFTSYFAQLKYLEYNKIIPISIALYAPNFYNGLEYKKLAPTPRMFRHYKSTKDKTKYIDDYSILLLRLSVDEVLNDISKLIGMDYREANIALLCYERADSFCHRFLVSKWLNHHDIWCNEFNTI